MRMIRRLWRGEIALWKTFWLFGVAGMLLLGIPIFSMMLALTEVPEETTALIFIFLLGLLGIYMIWVYVGIWRAANHYAGKQVWAILAKVIVTGKVVKILLFIGSVLFADTG